MTKTYYIINDKEYTAEETKDIIRKYFKEHNIKHFDLKALSIDYTIEKNIELNTFKIAHEIFGCNTMKGREDEEKNKAWCDWIKDYIMNKM